MYHTRLFDVYGGLLMFRLFSALILLPLLLLSGCGPDKDSPVYQRKQAFKQMMRHKEAMYGMLSGRVEYEPKRFAAELAQLQQASQKPWPLFTELKDSRAKEDVLLEPAAFKQSQDRYQQALADRQPIRVLQTVRLYQGCDSGIIARGDRAQRFAGLHHMHDGPALPHRLDVIGGCWRRSQRVSR